MTRTTIRKTTTLGFLILLCAVSLSGNAKNMARFSDKISSKLGLVELSTSHLANPALHHQAATLFTLLAYTQEQSIHQMNGETQNRVFLHKEGHKEAVYAADGKLVESCINQGSYNYYHPYQQPLGHFSADILPWLVWGNCKDDPSTHSQRVEAYIQDLKNGFKKALKERALFQLPQEFNFGADGQSVAISFYLKALERAKFDFAAFVPEKTQDQHQQEQFFKALKVGFNALLIEVRQR